MFSTVGLGKYQAHLDDHQRHEGGATKHVEGIE